MFVCLLVRLYVLVWGLLLRLLATGAAHGALKAHSPRSPRVLIGLSASASVGLGRCRLPRTTEQNRIETAAWQVTRILPVAYITNAEHRMA